MGKREKAWQAERTCEAACEFGSDARRWERSVGAGNVWQLTFSGHILLN